MQGMQTQSKFRQTLSLKLYPYTLLGKRIKLAIRRLASIELSHLLAVLRSGLPTIRRLKLLDCKDLELFY